MKKKFIQKYDWFQKHLHNLGNREIRIYRSDKLEIEKVANL